MQQRICPIASAAPRACMGARCAWWWDDGWEGCAIQVAARVLCVLCYLYAGKPDGELSPAGVRTHDR
jgi:hypothetical protein